MTSKQFCEQQVKRYDYDRFFSTTLASTRTRRALIALFAFNIEVSSIVEKVTEPTIRYMRLQWWSDTLEETYEGKTRKHPVAEELAAVINDFNIEKELLRQIVEARNIDLSDEAPSDVDNLIQYAAATGGNLCNVSQKICQSDSNSVGSIHLGTAWSLLGLLRSIPIHAYQRRIYVPQDILDRSNVTEKELIENPLNVDLKLVVNEFAKLIINETNKAGLVDKKIRPALAYTALIKPLLARIQKTNSLDNNGITRLMGQILMLRFNFRGTL